MPRKKNDNTQPLPPLPKDSCKYCHKSHLKLSKCSRCKEVFYCSTDCQKKDWLNHKKTCKPQTSEQQSPDPPIPDKEESCNNCGKSGVKLSTCSRCHAAKYCSKECQRAEWPKHKVCCKKNSDFLSGASQMFKRKCQDCFNICIKDSEYCDKCSQMKCRRNILFPLKVPDDVHIIARMRYPGFQLITNFLDIDPIDSFMERKQVLLVLMLENGLHLFRPSMIVRDGRQELLRLIFYLDSDDKPDPCKWDEFTVGNYICIMYPEIHCFLDLSVGFRVESTSFVSFIKH